MAEQTVRIVFTGNSADATRAMKQLEGGMRGLSSAAKVAIGAIGIAGLGAAFVGIVKVAVDFDRSMRNVNSIAKLTEAQFRSLSKEVLGLSKTTAKGPKDLADGLYGIVSSGFKAQDAMKVLAASAKAATAGMTDTATASKAVVAILNAYHLSADQARKVSDTLFQEVNLGVNTFEELASQIGDTAPAAAALGIPFAEVGAALATITRNGTSMAEASTQVARVLAQMVKPGKELTKEFERMGFQTGQAAIKALGFSGVIQRLSQDAKGNQKTLSEWLGDIRGIRGVINLTGANLATFTKMIRDMGGAQAGVGATQKAFAEQTKAIGFQWDKTKQSLAAASVPITQMLFPAIRRILDVIADWINKTENQKRVTDAVKDALKTLGEVITGLWPVVQTLAGAVKAAADAVGGLKNAILILLGLKFVSVLAGWSLALNGLIGTAAAGATGGAAGLAGAAGLSGLLFKSLSALSKLSIMGLVVTIAVELLPPKEKSVLWDILSAPARGATSILDKIFGTHLQDVASGKTTPPITLPVGGSIPGSVSGAVVPGGGNFGDYYKSRGHHETSGLPGFPAVDIMATPGTPVLAPEEGLIYKISGHDPAAGNQTSAGVGGYSVYLKGDSGTLYFFTHLDRIQVKMFQRVSAGQVLAVVASVAGIAPHVHVGVQGTPIRVPKGRSPAATSGGAGGATGGGLPPDKKTPPAFQVEDIAGVKALRVKLSDDALTKGTEDDLRDLLSLRKILDRARTKAKGERRRLINEALREVADSIDSINSGIRDKAKAARAKDAEAYAQVHMLDPASKARITANAEKNARELSKISADARAREALRRKNDAADYAQVHMLDPASLARIKANTEKNVKQYAQIVQTEMNRAMTAAKARSGVSTAEGFLSILMGMPKDATVEITNRFGQVVTLTISQIIPRIQAARKRLIEALASGDPFAIKKAQDAWQKLIGLLPSYVQAGNAKLAAAVAAGKVRVSAAFSTVLDSALAIFDKKTAALVAKTRVLVTSMTGAFGAFEFGAGDETPTERLIRERTKARQAAALQDAIDLAQQHLADAKTEEERLAAQKELDAALSAQQDAADETRAAAERKQADADLAARQAHIEEQRSILRDNFQRQYTDTVASWEAGKLTAAQASAEISRLMKHYGITDATDAESASLRMQIAFTTAMHEMRDAIHELIDALENARREAQGLGQDAKDAAEELNRLPSVPQGPAPPGGPGAGMWSGGIVRAARGLLVPGRGTGDTVPAMLTPGEMVLNAAQQAKLGGARLLKRVLGFAEGGDVTPPPQPQPGQTGQGGPLTFGILGRKPRSGILGAGNEIRSKEQEQANKAWEWIVENFPEEATAAAAALRAGDRGPYKALIEKWWRYYATNVLGYSDVAIGPPPFHVMPDQLSGYQSFAGGGIVQAAVTRFARGGPVGPPDVLRGPLRSPGGRGGRMSGLPDRYRGGLRASSYTRSRGSSGPDVSVNVNFADGMGWLSQYLTVDIGKKADRYAREGRL